MKTIVRLVLLTIVVTVLSFPFRETSQAAQTRGQSRGYLTTPAELIEIKRKADQGIQPYAGAVKYVLGYADRTWSFPFLSTETCGGPDVPEWLDNDGGAPILYGKALAYHMTGDPKYAAQVKDILQSIMTNVKDISLSEQRCRLVFGWGTPELVASADLIEGYWGGMTCNGPLSTINGQNTIGSGNCKKLFQNWLIRKSLLCRFVCCRTISEQLGRGRDECRRVYGRLRVGSIRCDADSPAAA